jgi:hypothetical protein
MGKFLTLGFIGFVSYELVLASGLGDFSNAMQVLNRGAYIIYMWTS